MNEENIAFNIADLFFKAAKQYPNKTAIIYKEEQILFAELEKQVNDTAQYFISKGITKGDRVLVFVPMSIDLYRIVLALFSMGATAVFLDEWVSKKRLEACCKIADCKAFVGIFKAKVLSFFSAELRKIPIKLGTDYSPAGGTVRVQPTFEHDTALITFTTGTTGTPKAAVRTHGFLKHQFNALKTEIDPQPDDVSMPVLPIVLLINLATGTTSVIADVNASKPDELEPGKVIYTIQRHNVNTIIASPFLIKRISEHINQHTIIISAMHKIFTGGAPVFAVEAAIYNEAFPYTEVKIVYGSTEAEPISTINIKNLLASKNDILKGLNAGKPAASAHVKIIKITDEVIEADTAEAFNQLVLPAHTIGEIVVSGQHVLRQYLNNDTALKRNKIFVGDTCWHRTGDSGYIGNDGSIFLMGRCNNIIQKGGTSFYPFVYENYFQTVNGVEAGALMLLKAQLTMVIQLDKGGKKSLIESTIKAQNPQVEQVVFIKQIPRDPRHNSKIDYQKLAEQLG